MPERKPQSRISRRHLINAGRTALVGLAGVTFVAAAHNSTQPLTGEATQREHRPAGQGHASHGKNKGQHKHQHNKNKGQRKHQRQHKRKSGKTSTGDVQLSTGSVLPQSLVETKGGQFSAHMLLPFETFPTEAKLAEAVAKAEEMNLFILPKSVEAAKHKSPKGAGAEKHKSPKGAGAAKHK